MSGDLTPDQKRAIEWLMAQQGGPIPAPLTGHLRRTFNLTFLEAVHVMAGVKRKGGKTYA